MTEWTEEDGGESDGSPTAPSAPVRDAVLHLPLLRPLDFRSFALAMIAGLLLLHTVRAAGTFLLPVALAVLAHFVLSPISRALQRIGVPAPLAATLIVVTGFGVAIGGTMLLSGPASEWLDRAPRTLNELERRLRFMERPMARVVQATQDVADLATLDKSENKVVVKESGGLVGSLLEQTRSAVVALVITFALLFFTLASGDAFVRKVVRTLPEGIDRERVRGLLFSIQNEVSRYLAWVSLINVALGVVVGCAMWLAGIPNPVLWGVVAGALNFMPFVGAVTTLTILTGVSLFTFDDPLRAMVAPLTFALLTGLEGLVVTPAILGRRLTLSPVVIFLSLLLWSWLWGIPGALIAVPMIAAFKIVCDHVAPLERIGIVLGADGE